MVFRKKNIVPAGTTKGLSDQSGHLNSHNAALSLALFLFAGFLRPAFIRHRRRQGFGTFGNLRTPSF